MNTYPYQARGGGMSCRTRLPAPVPGTGQRPCILTYSLILGLGQRLVQLPGFLGLLVVGIGSGPGGQSLIEMVAGVVLALLIVGDLGQP